MWKKQKRKSPSKVHFPAGYTLSWSGQYEYMQRAQEKLIYVVPFTLLIIFLLLYINFKSVGRCAIVLLAVPFSMIGAIWLLYLLGYNMSVAVWVGIIALGRRGRGDRRHHASVSRARIREVAHRGPHAERSMISTKRLSKAR